MLALDVSRVLQGSGGEWMEMRSGVFDGTRKVGERGGLWFEQGGLIDKSPWERLYLYRAADASIRLCSCEIDFVVWVFSGTANAKWMNA